MEALIFTLALLFMTYSNVVSQHPTQQYAQQASAKCPGSVFPATYSKGLAPPLIVVHGVADPASCCAACSNYTSCRVWTLNTQDTPTKCTLKGELQGVLDKGAHPGCTTGVFPAPVVPPSPPSPTHGPWEVFTSQQVAGCGRIRIPELAITPSRIILFAQCRGVATATAPKATVKLAYYQNNTTVTTAMPRLASAAAAAALSSGGTSGTSVGDNMINATVISVHSQDGGRSWSNYTVHTPVSYSHGAPVYDRVRKRVLLQYQHHPNVNPELNSSYKQRISLDDGVTWGPERDITHLLSHCNPQSPQQMEVESAGSKIQSSSGRILFTGHSHGAGSAIWYTDDGGDTFTCESRFAGNEISMAELAPGHLVMNGRAGTFPWAPHRTHWESFDDGKTWSDPSQSQLLDDGGHECEGALIAANFTTTVSQGAMGGLEDGRPQPNSPLTSSLRNSGVVQKGQNRKLAAAVVSRTVIFFSEPEGTMPKRTALALRCSFDGGKTWPGAYFVDGDAPAAYSDMRLLSEPGQSQDHAWPGQQRRDSVSGQPKKYHYHDAETSKLLVVWEANDGMVSAQVGLDWCFLHAP